MRALAISLAVLAVWMSPSALAQHSGGSRHDRGHVDYQVELHNETDEELQVSCNNGRTRHLDAHDTTHITFRAAHGLAEVTCHAYDPHDGRLVSTEHVDLHEGSRETQITFRSRH